MCQGQPLHHPVRLVLPWLFSLKETEALRCKATCPSSGRLNIEPDSQTWALDHSAAPTTSGEMALVGGVGGTYLLDEIHEAAAKAPRLVPVALQGIHSHLGCPLVAHGHDVHSIIQQGGVGLEGGCRACLRTASEFSAPLALSPTPFRTPAPLRHTGSLVRGSADT